MTIWSDVLSLLDETGWAQGIMQMSSENKHCLLSALGQVARERYGHFWGSDVSMEKKRELASFLGVSKDNIPDWNDALGRTFSDVESVLKTLHEREISEEVV